MADYIGGNNLLPVKSFKDNTSLVSLYSEALWNISNAVTVNGGLYSQYPDVPVGFGADASYSVLNRFNYYENHNLINAGKGRNYGIYLTFEKYMSKGYYYQANVSLFKAEYKGSDNVWRNTRFNRGYVLKALGGKEWFLGKNNQNVLNIGAKFTYMGGLLYSPVDEEASRANTDYEVVFDETKAFSKQLKPDYCIDFTVSYKINKKLRTGGLYEACV